MLRLSVTLFVASASVVNAGIWLDQPLSNWNQPSARVPQAPTTSSDYAVRCKAHTRPPENLADQALVGAGWIPFGGLQSYGSTLIITAMSGADDSCHPIGYQAFVFSDGKVAGTLSPSLMDSQIEGSIQYIRLLSATAIEVDFFRMLASNTTIVRFEIQSNPTGPILVPLEVRHPKKDMPAPVTAAPIPESPKTPEPAMPKPTPPATPEVITTGMGL